MQRFILSLIFLAITIAFLETGFSGDSPSLLSSSWIEMYGEEQASYSPDKKITLAEPVNQGIDTQICSWCFPVIREYPAGLCLNENKRND